MNARAIGLLTFVAIVQAQNDSYPVLFPDKAGAGIYKGYAKNISFNYTASDAVLLSIDSMHKDIAVPLMEKMKLEPCPNSTTCSSHITLKGVQLGRTEIKFTLNDTKNGTLDNLKVSVIRVPDPISIMYGFILLALQIILNFILGCKLNIGVVVKNLKKPMAVIVGVTCQFVLMPLIAFGLAMAFELDNVLALGLLVTGCAPGGGTSNIFAVLLDGDVDLSITMTTITCTLAFGSMPLWLFVYARFFSQGVAPVNIPYFNIMTTLVTATIPLIPGIIIRKCKRSLADKIAKIIQPFSLILVLATTGVSIYNGLYIFSLFTWDRFISSSLLPLCGLIMGMLVALIFRRKLQQIKTIGLETGIQNSVLSIAVITISQPQPDGDIMYIMPSYSVMFILLLLIIVAVIHKVCMRCSPRYAKFHEAEASSMSVSGDETSEEVDSYKMADGQVNTGFTNDFENVTRI